MIYMVLYIRKNIYMIYMVLYIIQYMYSIDFISLSVFVSDLTTHDPHRPFYPRLVGHS